jgi:hypothetical protein
MISQLPIFLDAKAIEYIFKVSRLDIDINELKEKLDDIRATLSILIKQNKSVKKRSLISNSLFTTEHKSVFTKSNDKHIVHDYKDNLSVKELSDFLAKRESLNENVAKLAYIVKEMEETYQSKRKEYMLLRKNELDRMNREFLFGDYSRRFEHIALKTVAAAIVGQDSSKVEVVRHNRDHKVNLFNFRHIMRE